MIKTIIIDRGHATLSADKKYITPGKQAKLSDGRYVYEGRENQKYAEVLATLARRGGYKVEFTVDPKDPSDPSLDRRVRIANSLPDRHNAIFISLHNNAGGNQTATGTEIFTSVGQSLSDTYADGILFVLSTIFPKRRLRVDKRDGDLDKEENFYVLRKTVMPSILIEAGFFDNPTDYDWLSKKENIESFCAAILAGIMNTDIKLYGEDAYYSRNN